MANNKKQPARKARTERTPFDLLKLFLVTIADLYPLDVTAPGIVQAYLRDKKEFYISFVRYNGRATRDEPNADGKEVLACATGKTLEDAIVALMVKFRDGMSRANELRGALKRIPHAGISVRRVRADRVVHNIMGNDFVDDVLGE